MSDESPQLENGYTRIATTLLEAIIVFPFSKREYKVVFAVIRKTYGYNKKSDEFSLTQIAKMTGLTPAHASETVSGLKAKNVLLKQEGKHANTLSLNKNSTLWGIPKTGVLPKQEQRYSQNGTKPIPETGTTIDKPINNTNRGNKTKRFVPPTPTEVAAYVKERGCAVDPQRFCDHYTAKGWMIGKNKMKDWKAAVRTWEGRDKPKASDEVGHWR